MTTHPHTPHTPKSETMKGRPPQRPETELTGSHVGSLRETTQSLLAKGN